MANTEEDDDSTSASGVDPGQEEAVASVKKKRLYTDEEWVKNMDPQERKFMLENIKMDDFLEDAKVLCTICNQQVNHKHEDMLCRHPLLGVVMCKKCKAFFFKGVWKRDEEGYFEHCRWCANGGDLVCCNNDQCQNSFCIKCIKRNLGRNKVSEVQEKENWECLTCDVSQVRDLRLMFYSIYQSWQRDKAKKEAREARKREKEEEEQDPISQLMKEAITFQKSFKDSVDSKKRHWKQIKEKYVQHADGTPSAVDVQMDTRLTVSALRRIFARGIEQLRRLDQVAMSTFPQASQNGGEEETEEDAIDGGEDDMTSGGDRSSQEESVAEEPVTNGKGASPSSAKSPRKDSPKQKKATNEPVVKREVLEEEEKPKMTTREKSLPVANGISGDVAKPKCEAQENTKETSNLEKVKASPKDDSDGNNDFERIKKSVLEPSSSEEEPEEPKSSPKKKRESKRAADDEEELMDVDGGSPSKQKSKLKALKTKPSPKSKKRNVEEIPSDHGDNESSNDGGNDDNLGLGTDSDTEEDADNSDHEFKFSDAVKASKKKKVSRHLPAEVRIQNRYAKLIEEVDVTTDVKLNGKVRVVCTELSESVIKNLDEEGVLEVAKFSELEKLCRGTRGRSKAVSFDAEIDRLCDLSLLEKKRSKRSKNSDDDSDDPEDSGQNERRRSKRDRASSLKKKLIDMSSGEDKDDDDTDDLSDNNDKKTKSSPSKGMTANELAKASVLGTSSSEEEETGAGASRKDKKERNKAVKNGQEEDEEDKASNDADKKKKKKKSDPDFMKVKLSESDSDEEALGSTKKRRKKGGSEDGQDEDEAMLNSRKKRKGRGKKKKSALDSDFECDSDVQAVEENEGGSDFKPEDSDSDVVVKKKRGKKRKKGESSTSSSSSSDDDSEEDSDSEEGDGKKKKKKKKKRKRIKKAGSSSDEDKDEKSPTKGRHNIRKIISDKKVSKETKSAALQERERRKRMDERQKLYNQQFEVKEGDEIKELPLDFNAESKEVLVEVDKRLVKKLKPHQAKGIKFMWDAVFETKKDVKKDKVPGGAILAHCMGLGKTLQTIALVHTVHTSFPSKIAKVLVLCPVNTVKNWEQEFELWLKGDLELDVHEMSVEKDAWGRADRLGMWMREGGVMIMGYDMFRNLTNETTKKFKKKQKETFRTALVDPGPDLVVCDEGHVLKNLKSALNAAMNKIKTRRRIILTGTPLQNNLSEYYAMVNFVKPQLLGTFNEFKNRFVNPIQNGQHSDSTERDVRVMKKRAFILNDLLKGCMQRLDYNVLVPYLQPKHEYVLCINLTEFQKKLYCYYLDNYARAGQIGSEGKMEGGKKGGLFYDVQNLSRVWNHPYILKMAKTRADLKSMFEDNDEEGSLKDFIDDADASDAATTESESGNDEVELLEEEASSFRRRTTRNAKDKETLVGGLEEAQEEALNSDKGWWHQFLENEDDLDKVELGSKMILLLDILRECELMGDKVLVFSQSLLSLDLIQDFLHKLDSEKESKPSEEADESGISYLGSWKHGVDYFRMDGSTQPEQRKKWCNYFNKKTNHQMRLFLISTKAGGLGINLCAANRVIIFDASWNPAHDVQSIFRVYRFGQDKPVYIYRFLAKGTMEEKIYDRQVAKQSLSARVVDEHQIERHFSMNELAELYSYNDEPQDQRPVPKVPKDLLLADLLKKHATLIWKYHDHDSLLENQVDENLTEEERKAAWEEFENEKKGLVSVASNPAIQNAILTNINPAYIQEQYRLQYPHLTEEQVAHATKAYIMQLQSGITRKPAYDRSHYQEEMVKAKAQQMAMYPNMYSQRQREAVQQQLQAFQQQRQQLQQSGSGASSSSSTSSSSQRDQWTNQVLSQQRDYQARISAERQQQAQTLQHAYIQQMQQMAKAQQQARMAARGMGRQQRSQPEEITLDDDGDDTGGGDDTIQLDGDPEFVTVSPPKSFPAPGTSRRGRPRLDPETDDPLGEISHGARAMQQMREMAAAMKAKQDRPQT